MAKSRSMLAEAPAALSLAGPDLRQCKRGRREDPVTTGNGRIERKILPYDGHLFILDLRNELAKLVLALLFFGGSMFRAP